VTTPADPVVIVSNRGPLQHDRGADGQRVATRGGGGLVTALSGSPRSSTTPCGCAPRSPKRT
jgi:trehalose-6-phosphate synthase